MADKDYYAFQVAPSRLGRRNWRLRSSSQKVTCIVMHTTEGHPDRKGQDTGAEGCAKYFSKTKRAASSHPIVDTDSTVFYLPSRYMAWHCKGLNARSVGIEMATQAGKWGWLLEHARDWALDMLWRTARVAAGYAVTYDIPAKKISASMARKGAKGFLGHGQADPKRRTDPGRDFPWELFLDMVTSIKEEHENGDGGRPGDVSVAEYHRLCEEHGRLPEFEPDSRGNVTRRAVRKAVQSQASGAAAKGAEIFKGMDKKIAMIERSVKDNIAAIAQHSACLDDLADEISDLTRALNKTNKEMAVLKGRIDALQDQIDNGGPTVAYEATNWQATPTKAGSIVPPELPPQDPPEPETFSPQRKWLTPPKERWYPFTDPDKYPIGLRNNNPGNLRYGGIDWNGLDGTPENSWDFCKFRHPWFGIRAAARNARTQVRKGFNTPSALFNIWAPSSDGNQPDKYAQYVAGKMGISTETLLEEDLDTWVSLIKAIAQLENHAGTDAYVWYPSAMFRSAVASGLGVEVE